VVSRASETQSATDPASGRFDIRCVLDIVSGVYRFFIPDVHDGQDA
jgi:hypothetical protein